MNELYLHFKNYILKYIDISSRKTFKCDQTLKQVLAFLFINIFIKYVPVFNILYE